MSLDDYERFVIAALFLDRPDPVAEWKALGRRQAGLVEYMSRAKTIRIESDGTDLVLSVAGRTWINSDGRRNMPSGEIFTGPIEDSATGELRCGFPVCRDGRELSGIALQFREGEVISARAEQGEDYLLAMLDLDPGPGGWASSAWGSIRALIASLAAFYTTRRSAERFTWLWARAIPKRAASIVRHSIGI